MKYLFLPFMVFMFSFNAVGQEINFGQFYDAGTLDVTVIQHLDFGGVIAGDTQPKLRELGSGNEGVIEIVALPFLDVVVTVQEIHKLFLDGDPTCSSSACEMDVVLNYAYTNVGIMDFGPNYENIAIHFIGNMARFQIVRRLAGPPGPPPPPSITGVSLPAVQSAYVYIFGEASASSDTNSGNYSNTLTVTIEYL